MLLQTLAATNAQKHPSQASYRVGPRQSVPFKNIRVGAGGIGNLPVPIGATRLCSCFAHVAKHCLLLERTLVRYLRCAQPNSATNNDHFCATCYAYCTPHEHSWITFPQRLTKSLGSTGATRNRIFGLPPPAVSSSSSRQDKGLSSGSTMPRS